VTAQHRTSDNTGDTTRDTTADLSWLDNDLFGDEGTSSHPPDSLVALRYLRDAVRRHARLWIAFALLGVAVGAAVPVVLPPAHESSVKLLMTHREGVDPVQAMATDSGMLSTQTVAHRVADELGLSDTPDELLQQYTATAVTERVLEIRAGAPTSRQATRLAATLGEVYLEFRQEQIALQAEPLLAALEEARGSVAEARAALVAVGEDPDDPALRPSDEARAYFEAVREHDFLEQELFSQRAVAARTSTSRVLDEAAPIPRSELLITARSVGSGLLAGLVLGVGFVVARALVSDRLWRRRDVSRALDTQVRLGVAGPRRWRWRPPFMSLPQYVQTAGRQQIGVRLAVQHLRSKIAWDERPKPALAIVSVNNERPAAIITASMALSLAEEGKRVLVADLSGTGWLAEALGVTRPGTSKSPLSNAGGASLRVYLPKKDAVPPGSHAYESDTFNAEFPAENEAQYMGWIRAEVVLVLATLSPALGAEHLQPWASRAVALVTAGKSTSGELVATAEMLRLAGLSLESAVMLRADRTDVTVGVGAQLADPPRG
jgi:capsular polysaccharide biosynthesis protein